MFEYIVTFAPTFAIWAKVVPFVPRSILNPVSLFELSVQERLIRLDDTAVATRFVGAAKVGVGVGVGVAVAVAVGVAVAVAVAVAVGVAVAVAVGVGVSVAVGVGVGVGPVAFWNMTSTQ